MSETRERLAGRLSEIAERLRGGVLEQRPLREPMTEEQRDIAAIEEAAALLSEPEKPRELLCMICGKEHPVWYAPNHLWNRVVRNPDGSDKWPFLCPTCFAVKAEEAGADGIFLLSVDEPERREPDADSEYREFAAFRAGWWRRAHLAASEIAGEHAMRREWDEYVFGTPSDSLIADPPHWTHIFVVDHDNGPYCGNCDVSPGDPTAADLCPASMETQTAAPEPEPDSEPTTGDLLAGDDSVGEPAESEGRSRQEVIGPFPPHYGAATADSEPAESEGETLPGLCDVEESLRLIEAAALGEDGADVPTEVALVRSAFRELRHQLQEAREGRHQKGAE